MLKGLSTDNVEVRKLQISVEINQVLKHRSVFIGAEISKIAGIHLLNFAPSECPELLHVAEEQGDSLSPGQHR